MFEQFEKVESGQLIKVVGVGGAGGNAVRHMIQKGLKNVGFICTNTDGQALTNTQAQVLIPLGSTGLGAGANPDVGRETADRQRDKIARALEGASMVFVTAGMGGGTGTGAAPVIAEVAREMGILTVGVVSKPFFFEGMRRMRVAEKGIEALNQHVDSLIIVLNERLEEVLGDDVTQKEAFIEADNVLFNAVSGITEIIGTTGTVNVDFEDVKAVMSERGRAMMGSGRASGENRARVAAEMAIACPLLEGVDLEGAKGLLVNISASEESLRMRETKEVMAIIREKTSEDANVIFGTVHDNTMGDELRVTVVATGLHDDYAQHAKATQASQQASPTLGALRQQAVSEAPGIVKGGRVEPNVFRNPRESEVQSSGGFDIPSFLRKSMRS